MKDNCFTEFCCFLSNRREPSWKKVLSVKEDLEGSGGEGGGSGDGDGEHM